jgi:hypothetical protein
MDEFECMRSIDESLQQLPDDLTRGRVVTWAAAKYLGNVGIGGANRGTPKVPSVPGNSTSEQAAINGEIAGIAKLSQAGEIQLTIRDLKARSTNDAAIRLVHVLLWAAAKLTGETSVSSKRVIVPWLRKYRCYDGNTRGAIAKDKGLVREGDAISLDFHAEQQAEKFAAEILDPGVEGKWKPASAKRRATKVSAESDGSGA